MNMDNNIPPSGLNLLANVIGSQSDIEAMIDETFKGMIFGMTFTDAVKLLHTKINTRIPTFTEFNLVRMCSTLLGDTINSSIALEYPPYWVYGLLLAASYGKNGLAVRLKQMRLDNDNKMFADNLNRSNQFIELLKA
jgi:hypothetical protein